MNDFLALVTASWFGIVSYGVMLAVLGETLSQALQNLRRLRSAALIETYMADLMASSRQTSPQKRACFVRDIMAEGYDTIYLCQRSEAFLREQMERPYSIMRGFEAGAPTMGVIFTLASFLVALPGILEALQSTPYVFFSKIAAGTGTSVIGLFAYLVANQLNILFETRIKRLKQTLGVAEAPGNERRGAA